MIVGQDAARASTIAILNTHSKSHPFRAPMSIVTPTAASAGAISVPESGIQSQIRVDLRHLWHDLSARNVFTTRQGRGVADLTGLETSELVAFRPERLVLHELLIGSPDFSVPTDRRSRTSDQLPEIARAILAQYIEPRQAAIIPLRACYADSLLTSLSTELAVLFPSPAGSVALPPRPQKSRLRRSSRVTRTAAVIDTAPIWRGRVIAVWGRKAIVAAMGCSRRFSRAWPGSRPRWSCAMGLYGGRDMIATLATTSRATVTGAMNLAA